MVEVDSQECDFGIRWEKGMCHKATEITHLNLASKLLNIWKS